MKTLIILISLMSVNSFAIDFYAGVNTWHPNDLHLNSNTDLFIVQSDNMALGTLTNSYNKQSVLLAYDLDFHYKNISQGVYLGGITGYGFPVVPLIGLYTEIEYKRVSLSVVAYGFSVNTVIGVKF